LDIHFRGPAKFFGRCGVANGKMPAGCYALLHATVANFGFPDSKFLANFRGNKSL
jgi:hypothetical protein